jgi:hypothetical protein
VYGYYGGSDGEAEIVEERFAGAEQLQLEL